MIAIVGGLPSKIRANKAIWTLGKEVIELDPLLMHAPESRADSSIDPGNEIARRFPYRECAPQTASPFLLFRESTSGRQLSWKGGMWT